MSSLSTIRGAEHSRESDGAKVRQFFEKHPDIYFVRFQFVDFSSLVKLYVLPKAAAIDAADAGFISGAISPYTCATTVMGTIIFENVEGDIDEMRPDWTSLKVCTYYQHHAVVMCFVRQPQTNKPKDGYLLDPRSVLLEQISSATERNLDILIGLEIEFLLMDTAFDLSKPAPQTAGYATAAMRNQFPPVVDEVVIALEKAGLKVMKYHPEEGVQGFFEIVLAPLRPLQAADALIYCHETIKTIAQQRELHATVAPNPFEEHCDIGSHINISISRPDHGNSESFLAGMLEHLGSICAFSMPNYDSYKRLNRLREWIRWGDKFKGCAIHQRRSGLWEIRAADATMNPYLAFAVIIRAGLEGVQTKKELKIKGVPNFKPLNEEQRAEHNITKKLPMSLDEALEELQNDEVLTGEDGGLGTEFVRYYTTVKKKEIELYATLSELERRLAIMKIF